MVYTARREEGENYERGGRHEEHEQYLPVIGGNLNVVVCKISMKKLRSVAKLQFLS